MDVREAEGDLLGGRLRLERKLGSGGFSSVWRAVVLATDDRVAVKILHREHEKTVGVIERFRQEAELLSRLEHESIARAYDGGTGDSPHFFTMEYVRGETLKARLERRSEDGRPIPLAGIAWLCDRIAGALSYAHARSVVHRDLKPANVMVNAAGDAPFVKVLDFGAAKALDGAHFDPTTVGRVIGSIAYLSPEQLRARAVDGRTDQFALAVVLYELLTLRRAWAFDAGGAPLPFHAPIGEHNSQLDVMRRILRGRRPCVRDVRPDLPSSVDDVLARALSTRPEERYESVEAFRTAFRIAVLDSKEMMPDGSLEDTLESGPFDDAEPTKELLAGDDGPTLPPEPEPEPRVRIRAAETEVNDLEATEEDLRDAARRLSTSGGQRGY